MAAVGNYPMDHAGVIQNGKNAVNRIDENQVMNELLKQEAK